MVDNRIFSFLDDSTFNLREQFYVTMKSLVAKKLTNQVYFNALDTYCEAHGRLIAVFAVNTYGFLCLLGYLPLALMLMGLVGLLPLVVGKWNRKVE